MNIMDQENFFDKLNGIPEHNVIELANQIGFRKEPIVDLAQALDDLKDYFILADAMLKLEKETKYLKDADYSVIPSISDDFVQKHKLSRSHSTFLFEAISATIRSLRRGEAPWYRRVENVE